jgi:hypothetical protein
MHELCGSYLFMRKLELKPIVGSGCSLTHLVYREVCAEIDNRTAWGSWQTYKRINDTVFRQAGDQPVPTNPEGAATVDAWKRTKIGKDTVPPWDRMVNEGIRRSDLGVGVSKAGIRN